MAPISKEDRAKVAKATINKTIPAILKSNPRARRGVEAAQLIVDPPPFKPSSSSSSNNNNKPTPSRPLKLKLLATDTLTAASTLATTRNPPFSRLAILNMASPLRPGGGVLTGATSQEEFLCTRTTLLHSLQEHFYRLPERGGVYTPDVLVFATPAAPARVRPKGEWFFVDVVTAAMLRFPDLDAEGGAYAEERDREAVGGKMRAVLRMCAARGVGRLVLGAWGCGAYGNPVGEVARAWSRVLLGKGRGKGVGEVWEGLREVVFAIKDERMAEEFGKMFGPELEVTREIEAAEGSEGGDGEGINHEDDPEAHVAVS